MKWHLIRLVVFNKTVLQQNNVKTLHNNKKFSETEKTHHGGHLTLPIFAYQDRSTKDARLRSVAQSFDRYWVERLIFNGPNNPEHLHLPVGPGPHLIHGYLTHASQSPKRHLDRSTVFAGLMNVTDKQTGTQADHATIATPSVATKPHLAISTMRSKNNGETFFLPRRIWRIATSKFGLYSAVRRWPVWLKGRAFARDPKGRGFESRPVRFQVTALGKLLTRMCLCYQAV